MPSIALQQSLVDSIALSAAERGIVLEGMFPRNSRGDLEVQVSFDFYNWLCAAMAPGETFTQAIKRLLAHRGASYAAGRE